MADECCRTVFSQLIAHLAHHEFQKCVARYYGDRHHRRLSCWDQYLAMTFAPLTNRESLRDIEACLRSMGGKLYHMGFRSKVPRSTLADARETHDWRIFADFAHFRWTRATGVRSDQTMILTAIESAKPIRMSSDG